MFTIKNKSSNKNIIVIGPSAVGKTCLTTMMVKLLQENNSSDRQTESSNSRSPVEYWDYLSKGGTVLDSFRLIETTYYEGHDHNVLQIKKNSFNGIQSNSTLMEFSTSDFGKSNCDDFLDYFKLELESLCHDGVLEDIRNQVDGCLLLLDPLEIGQIEHRDNYDLTNKWNGWGELIRILESIVDNKLVKGKTAIVFTKTDVSEINNIIGESAVEECISLTHKKRDDVIDEMCKSYLMYHKKYSLLNCIETKFPDSKFFVTGIYDDYLQHNTILAPLRWVLENN